VSAGGGQKRKKKARTIRVLTRNGTNERKRGEGKERFSAFLRCNGGGGGGGRKKREGEYFQSPHKATKWKRRERGIKTET